MLVRKKEDGADGLLKGGRDRIEGQIWQEEAYWRHQRPSRRRTRRELPAWRWRP